MTSQQQQEHKHHCHPRQGFAYYYQQEHVVEYDGDDDDDPKHLHNISTNNVKHHQQIKRQTTHRRKRFGLVISTSQILLSFFILYFAILGVTDRMYQHLKNDMMMKNNNKNNNHDMQKQIKSLRKRIRLPSSSTATTTTTTTKATTGKLSSQTTTNKQDDNNDINRKNDKLVVLSTLSSNVTNKIIVNNKYYNDRKKSDNNSNNYKVDNTNHHLSNTTTAPTRKWAYAFLLGGARSNRTNGASHRGGLYSVVVAARILRKYGSQADIVLLVQIASQTPYMTLNEQEEEVLKRMNIRVVYLPKYSHPKYENFFSLMMEKFRILNLTDYSRVMYLDYDMMPLCNLDYLFELSDPLLSASQTLSLQNDTNGNKFMLQENVAFASRNDPTNGGLFVMKPDATDFQIIQEIIHQQERHDLEELPFPHWNQKDGWNHTPMVLPDSYRVAGKGERYTKWNFYAAFADQGLIYYWMKYVKRSFSNIIHVNIEQWGTDSNGTLVRLADAEKGILHHYACNGPQMGHRFQPQSNGYIHMSGRGKPWNKKLVDLENATQTRSFTDFSEHELWYWYLKDALTSISMFDQISLDFISGWQRNSAVGISAPTLKQRATYLTNKRDNQWRQYENLEDEPAIIQAELPSTRKWAYAFLLGGARTNRLSASHRGGLYSVVVAAHVLRQYHSQADIILMVQVASETPYTTLNKEEEEVLSRMNIRVIYLPKYSDLKYETFFSLMMEKFRILNLTDYSRVMYLDYDMMPLCNLDYLFELSDPLLSSSQKLSFQNDTNGNKFMLQENVAFASRNDPTNGGLFIVKPNATDFQIIQEIIHQQERHDLEELPFPHWDEDQGWNHTPMLLPDSYRVAGKDERYTKWNFYAAFADQGLIYYWMKYVKKSFSNIIGESIEHWGTDSNGTLIGLEDVKNGILQRYACKPPKIGNIFKPHGFGYVHMSGRGKPWHKTWNHLENATQTKTFADYTEQEQWYWHLKDALTSIGMLDQISLDFLSGWQGTPMGSHAPTFKQRAKYLKNKQKNQWRQYVNLEDEPYIVQTELLQQNASSSS